MRSKLCCLIMLAICFFVSVDFAKAQDAETARDGKQIWAVVIIRVQVVQTKSLRKKEFTRLYVSEVTPISLDDFKKFYRTDERFIKPRLWEYFAATVVKAAATRGEEIQEPYDSNISYYFNADSSALRIDDTFSKMRPKSYVEEIREREIKYARDDSRPVIFFRWDPAGKNAQTDLEKEMKRGDSTELPF